MILRKGGTLLYFAFSNFFFNDFWVPRRRTYLGQKQNNSLGKKFSSPPPIEKYVLPTNQTHRGLENT